MSRVNPRTLDSNSKVKYLDLLWTSVAQLETKEEVKQFFKDLLSESEAIMLARRIEIAKRLIGGESYDEIASNLKVGTDTISRVQQWLTSGFGGYEKAVGSFEKELRQKFSKRSRINKEPPYSFGWIKQKYPLHFLIFNLLSSDKKHKRK
jgi:TrpR-related protein YerC/YecD